MVSPREQAALPRTLTFIIRDYTTPLASLSLDIMAVNVDVMALSRHCSATAWQNGMGKKGGRGWLICENQTVDVLVIAHR